MEAAGPSKLTFCYMHDARHYATRATEIGKTRGLGLIISSTCMYVVAGPRAASCGPMLSYIFHYI